MKDKFSFSFESGWSLTANDSICLFYLITLGRWYSVSKCNSIVLNHFSIDLKNLHWLCGFMVVISDAPGPAFELWSGARGATKSTRLRQLAVHILRLNLTHNLLILWSFFPQFWVCRDAKNFLIWTLTSFSSYFFKIHFIRSHFSHTASASVLILQRWVVLLWSWLTTIINHTNSFFLFFLFFHSPSCASCGGCGWWWGRSSKSQLIFGLVLGLEKKSEWLSSLLASVCSG